MDPFTINRIAQIQHEENVQWAAQNQHEQPLLQSAARFARRLISPAQKIMTTINAAPQKQAVRPSLADSDCV